MEFLKKNYEKVLLGVVVLGLTAAVCALPIIISGKRTALKDLSDKKTHPHVKPLPPLDTAVEDAALQRAQISVRLDFTSKHNLFNPVLWQKQSDGRLLKIATGNEVGPGAVEVVGVNPLYLVLTYGTNSESGYQISIERQGAARDKRNSSTIVSRENNRSEILSLRDVVGPPDKPTELVIELKESNEIIHLMTDKPYKEVQDYTADLKYPLEQNRVWHGQRVGNVLTFAGAQYKIVAITANTVVLSAQSNNKKTTITFNPASAQKN
jgi:hypothetical protein